ncbi:MAG TPA: F0F1 ATP synthase subunit A [Micropepsaceae bacterium]
MASPMEQFEVRPIVPLHVGNLDISFTNISLWMCIVVAAAILFLTAGASSRRLVPTRMQSITEMSYVFVADMIRSAAGTEGLKFFPFVFTLFMFVLFSNVIGLFPLIHPFTVTSHIIVTFSLAIFVFLMVIVVGLARHGLHFFSIFAPKVPLPMLILLVPIEIVSFLSRPISLSVRLFANMLAGHTMLYVFGTFVIGLAAAGGALSVISIAPFLAIVAVAALEFLIAFLQAYVFAILTCIYLNDALNLHEH